jgi:hypothetical protein
MNVSSASVMAAPTLACPLVHGGVELTAAKRCDLPAAPVQLVEVLLVLFSANHCDYL